MARQQEIEILLDAISDGQETIRAFDLKAEILTGILTFVVGLVTFAGHDVVPHSWVFWTELGVIATAFGAMTCLACLLYPANNPTNNLRTGSYVPTGMYYLSDSAVMNETVSDLAKKLATTGWTEELVFELMKVSSIRSRKSKWFKRAIGMSAAAFLLLLFVCAARFV
jgi:hypothetical protein